MTLLKLTSKSTDSSSKEIPNLLLSLSGDLYTSSKMTGTLLLRKPVLF